MNFGRLSFRGIPKTLVYIGPDETRRQFRIRVRWDGGLKVSPLESDSYSRAAILVLDAALPLRRLFRAPEKRRYTRNLLLATAADAFPFDLDEACYALGERSGKSYLFSLPKDGLEKLTEAMPKVRAILISESEQESALLDTLNRWFRQGNLYDLLGAARPIAPSAYRVFFLSLLVAGMGAGLVYSWEQRQANLEVKKQVYLEQIQSRVEPLLQRRQTLAHMVAAQRATSALHTLPSAIAIDRLDRLLALFPEGSRIERIQLKGSELILSGWGANPSAWLAKSLEPVTVDVTSYPKQDHFELFFDLTDGKQQASK